MYRTGQCQPLYVYMGFDESPLSLLFVSVNLCYFCVSFFFSTLHMGYTRKATQLK